MSNVKAYLEDIVRDGLHDIAEALKGSSPSGDVQASHVIYDNTESGLTSTRVQGAIDELSTKADTNTSDISDLGDDVSDLTYRMGAAEGDITSLDGRLDTAEGDITALETWKNNLDAGDIPYGSGTVKDALDEVHTWTKFGTTTSTTASALSIPASASEVLIVLKTSAVLATAIIPKEEFNNSWSIKNPADTTKEVYHSGSQWRVTASGYTADAYYR